MPCGADMHQYRGLIHMSEECAQLWPWLSSQRRGNPLCWLVSNACTRMHTRTHMHTLSCLFPVQSFPSLEERVGLQSEDILSAHPSHCPSLGLDLCCLAQTITVVHTDISSLVFSLSSALRLPDHSLLVAKNGHSPFSSPKPVIANRDGTNLATPLLTKVFCPSWSCNC